jgi:DNA (cytosine-5)-methyltransferase 3A
MNVLSLFDGMSCGQIALYELGMYPDKYYACEIDKFAIAQTKLNFPDTIFLGDVTKLDVSKLDKIDLVIGGSPCQSFSFAGKRVGMSTESKEEVTTLAQYMELKEKGFQFAGQSYLFWEYMRILTDIRKYNPNVLFLLENVEMGKKWERVLSEAIGVDGVHINSALVSAQNRKRIYWTNIRTRGNGRFSELQSDIPQPEDRGILLKDILEDEVDEKYYLSNKTISGLMDHKQRHTEKGNGFGAQFPTVKSNTLLARCYKDGKENLICVAMRGRNPDNPSDRRAGSPTKQRLEPNTSGKTNCLTTVQKDDLIAEDVRVKGVSYTDRGIRPHRGDFRKSGVSEYGTILYTDQKSNTYIASHVGLIVEGENPLNKGRKANDMTPLGFARIRRLTPTECARLQTIPYWYKWACSDTQQYKMLGNGWTVAVIYHIFSFIKY